MRTNEDPIWQSKLTAIVENHAEGDVIPHSTINEILGLKEPNFDDYDSPVEYKEAMQAYAFQRLSVIEQLKHDLLTCHQVYIKNVKAEGYRIVPAKDQCTTAYKVATSNIHDEFEQGNLVMDNVRETSLNADEKKKANDTRAKFALLQKIFEDNRK